MRERASERNLSWLRTKGGGVREQALRQLVRGRALAPEVLVRSGTVNALACFLAPAHVRACASWPAFRGCGRAVSQEMVACLVETLDAPFHPLQPPEPALREYQQVRPPFTLTSCGSQPHGDSLGRN